MHKKMICAILSTLLAVSVLGGCGNKETQTGNDNAVATVESTTSEAVEAAVTEATEAAVTEATETAVSEASVTEESAATETTGEEAMVLIKDAVASALNGARMGCAATEGEMKDPKVWELITTHFNVITFGNELKPDAMVGYSVGRCPGTQEAELNGETIIVPKLDYSRAERMCNKILEWNQANPDNQIHIKGHVLLWHAQTPEWFFHEDYDKTKPYVDKDTMNKRLEWYIRTMLQHFTGEDSKYNGLFYGWDVVNEAISDNDARVYRSDAENPNESLSEDRHGSNSSWWHVYQSNEFIINAFIYANKYAPADLELYYNDYGECNSKKIVKICELLQAVKDAEGEPGVGTRITAMGMQGHYNMTDPAFNFLDLAIKRYCKIVGAVQISELDMAARDSYDGSEEAKPEEYQKQYVRYKVLYKTMVNAAQAEDINVTGITFWGTSDQYSWLQSSSNLGGGSTSGLPQCPLLFDEHYQIKPAYYAFTEE